LVRNAIEHGGESVTVTVGELDSGFYVADDGMGIPKDEREQIFEVGDSMSNAGTGIGLSIVQQIADTHDWEISITDSAEGGARIELRNVEVLS
jgi:signal transduction histidine kinase